MTELLIVCMVLKIVLILYRFLVLLNPIISLSWSYVKLFPNSTISNSLTSHNGSYLMQFSVRGKITAETIEAV
jgi:hypothetical protein